VDLVGVFKASKHDMRYLSGILKSRFDLGFTSSAIKWFACFVYISLAGAAGQVLHSGNFS